MQIRFHYYEASFEWWWMVDNVKVTIAVVPGCTNNVCASGGPQAKPVNALDASRVDPTTIDVAWDVASCTSTDYEILYGNLSSLPSYTLLGSVCGIGTSGTTTWSGVPAGDLWFLVTGLDGAGRRPRGARPRASATAAPPPVSAATRPGTTEPAAPDPAAAAFFDPAG